MNLLQMQRGSKHFGTRVLFDGASFAVNEGEHVGVIGPNGAGKTTLFKILVGQDALDSGQLTRAQSLRIGYLEQESERTLNQSSEEYLTENCIKPIWELKQHGRALGLEPTHFQAPLAELSGGYRMRMKLLYLIGQEPNLMLLDEPTNFLDLESVLALESFLQGYTGAFLLISHDREFLRRTTEFTLEVEGGDITKFPGNIDDYFEQKAQLREVLSAQSANRELKRKQIQEFVDRFRAKASKAKQAQSRMKQLAKMDGIALKDLPVRARIKIPEPVHTGRETLVIKNADLGYGDYTVLKQVELRLERGAHLGVVGHNGAGKSTLLKALGGRLPLLNGELTYGYQVSLSYFSQHVAEQLDLNDSVLDALQRTAHSGVKGQDILNMAGSLLFSGDDVHKKIRILSGGEKSRVALGQILLKRSPLLLLDEPTNHLDFDTVEALTEALRAYPGSLITVSHDRSFIGRVANQILEIRDRRLELFPGTYDEYVWSLQKGVMRDRESSEPEHAVATTRVSTSNKSSTRDESKRLQSQVRELQKAIGKLETRIATLSATRDRLTTELLTQQGIAAQALAKELGLCAQEIESLETELIEKMDGLEGAERALTRPRSN